MLQALSFDLEQQAASHPDAVILSNFEEGISGASAIKNRYEALARTCPFVVGLGADLPPMDEVHGGEADHSDPLRNERAVVVLTPHFSAALLARHSGEPGSGDEYTFAITYDRGLATRAARMLIAHVEA